MKLKVNNNPKSIIILGVIVCAIIIITLIILFLIKPNNKEQNYSNKYYEALSAYNELLSKETIEIETDYITPLGNKEKWNADECKFLVAYIDDDDIPELLLQYTGEDHEGPVGVFFTYDDNILQSALFQLYMPGIEKLGYYERSGYFKISHQMWSDEEGEYGRMYIVNIKNDKKLSNVEVRDKIYFIKEWGYSKKNSEGDITYCSIIYPDDRGIVDFLNDDEEFNSEFNRIIENSSFVEYVFLDNNKENRKKYLC